MNLRLLCAILRLLDAIDIRRNRALSTEANFSVLMKDVRSEFSVCNNCENKDCASKILKTIEAVLDFFQDYTVKYFTKAFTLKMYKTYEKKCIKWISEISNIIEKGACLVNCVDKIKILTMIIETPFHYGKHNTFLGVFFDENQKIVYLPDMKKTVEEINYFFNSCSITNVMNDFNSELTVDVKTILYDNGIQISDPILFNPLLHGKFLNQYFTIKRT